MQGFPWHTLLLWYQSNGRHGLPWRIYDSHTPLDEHTLLYRIWISEIFLQQTQVSRVIGYFERVMLRFPTIESLAQADYDTFFHFYQGLGYYSRARNILKTAELITEEYGGIFPKEKSILEKLPGVGPYTASALLAFGYGEPHLAWDTNLEKVFSRYFKGRKDIKLTKEEKEEIEEDFRGFCISHCEEGVCICDEGCGNPVSGNTERWIASHTLAMTVRDINNALMDFAALVDLKRSEQIDWEKYPIQSGVFYETHGTLEPKEVKQSVTFPIPDATVIVILHKDHRVYYGSPLTIISSESSVIPADAGILGGNYENRFRDKPGMTGTFVRNIKGQEQYTPFLLPPPLHRDTRKYVQEYFRTHYALELSVRPIQKKWISKDGKPYVLVNAQIQTGKHSFDEFSKKDYLSFVERLYSL